MIQQKGLQEILPIEELEKILRDFCQATNLITIVSDFRGNMLTSEKNTVYYTPFCKKARLTGCSINNCCMRSDAMGSLEAAQRGEPFIYRCHLGFVEISAPIIVNNMYLGAILMGQVRTDPEIMETLPQVFSSSLDALGHPELKELLQSSWANASYVPYEQLKAFAALMSNVTNYIVQSALNYSLKAELSEMHIHQLEEQNHAATLEKDLAFLRLKNLKMRIHPHFLYNTLNVISGLAVMEDAEQTALAISSLADTLRFALKHQEELISLRDEMNCVTSYINIQKLLLQDRVQFLSDVDADCMEARIPLYTIQILVENACLHGFYNQISSGHFSLRIRRDHKNLLIHAENTGNSIDPDVARHLNHLTSESMKDMPDSALLSLFSSFHHYYNKNEVSWEISAIHPSGTSVFLKLPFCQETDLQKTDPYIYGDQS